MWINQRFVLKGDAVPLTAPQVPNGTGSGMSS
jgi:hypothetical protein